MQQLRWYTPALYGILAIVFLQYSGLDLWLAEQIFALHQGWVWQNSWILESILHIGGRSVVAVLLASILLLTLISFIFNLFNQIQRMALLYTLSASLLSILVISVLKHLTLLPCPWDVQGLGGDQTYLYLHEAFSSHTAGRQCFPAGHASGGYALFSLYFCLKLWRSSTSKTLNFYWLIPALLAGGLFGLAQQLRGAHFLSHDITTALLCWYCCLGLWWGFARRLNPTIETAKRAYLPLITPANKTHSSGSNAFTLSEKSQ
ncbi:phosphatase PAP2 family protein [Paraglaciecola sp.]|uniref:phosphatase PAP2 family protein n=1 Tax=Paraglaciecola sp. TaxID=1920173 RepID=UPI0030F3CE3E